MPFADYSQTFKGYILEVLVRCKSAGEIHNIPKPDQTVVELAIELYVKLPNAITQY